MKNIVKKIVILACISQFYVEPSVALSETVKLSHVQYNGNQNLDNIETKNEMTKREITTDQNGYDDLVESSTDSPEIDSEIELNLENEINKEIIKSENKVEIDEINSNSDGTGSEDLELVKERLASHIEMMSFDDVLSDFGGRRVKANAFKDKYLHVQVSEENIDLDKIQLDDTFKEIKQNRVEFIDNILLNFSDYNTLTSNELENHFLDTLNQLLMVKVYLERWYGIEIEGQKLSDNLYYKESTGNNILAIAKKFKNKPELMDSNVTGQTYRVELAGYFQYKTVKDLVESFVTESAKTTNYNEWFKNYFGGSVIELQASFDQINISTWDKICTNTSDETSANHLLPILTLKNPENMIIGNVQGLIVYSTKHNFENYEKQVLRALENFNYYINTQVNTQSSIVEKNRIISNLKTMPVYDSELEDEKYDYFKEENSLSNGFYKAIHQLGSLNYNYSGINAWANGSMIQFVSADINTNNGGTLAHEHYHNTGGLLMNSNQKSNWGFRNSRHVEVIAARIDYSWYPEDGVLFNIFDKDATVSWGLSNSGGRFKEDKDLQEYYKGIMGLVYGLDVVVADVILSLPVADQIGYVRKWDKTNNTITTLNEEELVELNLKTIKDLIDSDIGIFDKWIPDGETPDNYGFGSSSYSLDSHYFIPEDGIYDSDHSEFTYMIQMVDELFSLQQYSGWDAVNLFFGNGKGASSNLDALRIVMNDSTFTFKDFREMQLNTYGNKIKENGLIEDSYKEIFDKVKGNLKNIRDVKEKYYMKYNKLTNEFRTQLFEEVNQPVIDAPNINSLTNFSKEAIITSPKLESDLTYELIISVNDSEVGKVAIKSEETINLEMRFNKDDQVTAYIIGIDKNGDKFIGQEAKVIVGGIGNIDELVIPPLDPKFPEIKSPVPENSNLGEGLSIVLVSNIVFPKIKIKNKSQRISAMQDKESSHMVAVANYQTGTKKNRQWTLQVTQDSTFENGATIIIAPFIAAEYVEEYGVTVSNSEMELNTESSIVAYSDGSGDVGIVPIGMGKVSLEVPGQVALGTSTSIVKWVLVSEPESLQ